MGETQSFKQERGIEPKVDLDVSVVSVGSLIEFDPVDEELHRHRPLHPGFAVIVLIGHPQIPEGLEDQGVVVMREFLRDLRRLFGRDPGVEAALKMVGSLQATGCTER